MEAITTPPPFSSIVPASRETLDRDEWDRERRGVQRALEARGCVLDVRRPLDWADRYDAAWELIHVVERLLFGRPDDARAELDDLHARATWLRREAVRRLG